MTKEKADLTNQVMRRMRELEDALDMPYNSTLDQIIAEAREQRETIVVLEKNVEELEGECEYIFEKAEIEAREAKKRANERARKIIKRIREQHS